MAKFQMGISLNTDENITARLADGTGSANQFDKTENNKLVKMVGDSRYGLCAAGDPIEGQVYVANDIAPADGFNLGSVMPHDDGARIAVTLDGLQATPGVGTVAVGDYVVCGTVVARGTSLSGANPKVCKATNQPGAAVTAADNLVATVNAAIAKMIDQAKVAQFGWRVVSILNGGTGAPGDTAVIEAV